MTVRNKVGAVGTLAQEAVSTAFSIARHPIGSAALAAGLVKGATGASVDLVRSTITGRTSEPTGPTETSGPSESAATETTPAPSPVVVVPEVDDPRDDIPGPDVFAPEVPAADDLPEPIVIRAEDASGEVFHTEPKAASRDSDHGGLAGDREEIEGYVEEIPEPDQDTPVWTSETPLDQPSSDSVFDEAAAKTVRSEADVLQKAADLHKE